MNKPILNPKSVAITRGALPGSRKLLRRTACRSAKCRCRAARRRCGCTTRPVRIRTIPSTIDIEKGLAARRRDWILARGDVEEYDGRDRKPEDDGLKRGELLSVPQFDRARRQAAARQAGQERHPASLCAPGHHHRGDEIHRRPRKSGPQRCWPTATASAPTSRTRSRRNSCATRSRAAAPSSRPTSTIPKPSR